VNQAPRAHPSSTRNKDSFSTQVIYGVHPILEALKSGHLQFQKILVGSHHSHPGIQAIMDLACQRHVPVVSATKEDLDRITREGSHQNIAGVIREFPSPDMKDLLAQWKKTGGKALFLILDGIQDPQNLGALIRTAAGFGAQGIIIPKDRAAGVTPAVIKASAGAIAHLPVVKVVNIANTIDLLKKEGVWVYGAAAEANEPVYGVDFTIDLAIVIGSEGKGMRPLVRKKCDRLFSIPMEGPISSFNASVSGGMILYEVLRQRRMKNKE
jgi:23S rRNA (guanosine2251-2'-O)-methyltransferase